MLKEFKFETQNGTIIPVSASSWKEAEEILQAYIDKRSLNWTITKCQNLNLK